MLTEETYALIAQERPRLIFLSGKTCTGKSTFAKSLSAELGYSIIELDTIVRESVMRPLGLTDSGEIFVELYRKRERKDWLARFVLAVRHQIDMFFQKGTPVVIEGALAASETLQEILSGYPPISFIYFHPEDTATYAAYLTSRFMQTTADTNAGLPQAFWQLVDSGEFSTFCKTRICSPGLKRSILEFAAQSQIESERRLGEFQKTFPDIVVTNPGK